MKELFFKRFRNPLIGVVVVALATGFFAFRHIKTALLPNVNFPQVRIVADNGEQPVDRMMITVTRPLEEAIKQVPYLQKVYSATSRGSCEIDVYLDWGANIDISKQQIESRINQAKTQLPPGVHIEVEKMSMYSTTAVMGYILRSPDKTPIDLTWIAKYNIKPFFSQIKGVSRVEISGGRNKEYWAELDIAKMANLGVTPEMVKKAIGNSDFIKSNGYSSDYRRLYLSLTDASVYNVRQLENIIVKSDTSGYVRLKDIANIKVHEETAYTRINADGKRAIIIDVLQQPNANLVDLSKRMTQKVQELRKILPPDVTITPYYNQASFVNDAIESVKDALLIGLGLAIIIVIIFLRSYRASLAVLVIIPVTLSATLIWLYDIGQTFNIMTLGAIAASIGLIIDDAIVVVEQIHRIKEENPQMASYEVTHKAIHKLLPAMIGSSLSTIVIFIPFIFLLTGISGAYFKVLAMTMLIALVCSFFTTWLLLPVVYSYFGRTMKAAKTSHRLKRQEWVWAFLNKPWISLGIVSLLIVSFLYVYPKLKTGFLPAMDEGTIVMDYFTPPGTSFTETDSTLMRVERAVASVPEVKTYVRRTGTQMGFFITEPNMGDWLIQLKQKRKKTTEEVINEIRRKIQQTGMNINPDFGQRIEDIIGDLIGSVQPIQIKIYGDDPDKLDTLAVQASNVISGVKGLADIFDGVTIAGPYINVKPDLTKLKQYGISPGDFQFQLKTRLSGTVAGNVFDKQQMTNIRIIEDTEANKQSVDEMKKGFIFLPDARLQPVTHLAKIILSHGVAESDRENLQPVVKVTARLENADLGTAIKGVKKAIAKKLVLPQGYHVSYGGAYEQQQKSFSELLLVLVTSCILVFGIVLFLFRDFRAAFIVLFIAVLGVTGSCIALYITGTPLNVGSYTGLIMIVGIVGENAIFTFRQFEQDRETASVKEALVHAISNRLRPNVMTVLCAIIALMPLALGIGAGASLHQPLAIAVVGGFIIALPLLLIIFPSLLAMAYREKGNKE